METLAPMILPVGYRFAPTDEELIKYYLSSKVYYSYVPAQPIRDIHAISMFGQPPDCLVDGNSGREWFFFIHEDEYFGGKITQNRIIGNGGGFWRCVGSEVPVYNKNGDILAFKIHLNYYSGSLPNAKKTIWRLEEYRLQIGCETEKPEAKCILGRILKGREYKEHI